MSNQYFFYYIAIAAQLDLVEKMDLDELTPGDYVVVVKGMSKGYYATVLGNGYGDEVEINYFQKKEKWGL